MLKRTCWLVLAGAILAASASASIIDITTSTSGLLRNFESITLSRAGNNYTYTYSELIGFDVTAFNCGTANPIVVPDTGSAPPAGQRAALLDVDRALNTGLLNLDDNPSADPGGDPTGLRIVFSSPVTNSDGADVIFFEIQAASGTDADKPESVAVKVTGGGTEKSYTYTDYSGRLLPSNINLDVFTTGAEVHTLAALESATLTKSSDANTFNVYGLEIDLSLLGVAPGATVTSLDFRSVVAGKQVDPTFIAGLPAVPEPSTLLLMALGGAGLVARRRR